MAHKKGQGSSRNGRDSNSKRRGVKEFRGEYVSSGGMRFLTGSVGFAYDAGVNGGTGRDWTLSAVVDGHVKFEKGKRRVGVTPLSAPAAEAAATAATN